MNTTNFEMSAFVLSLFCLVYSLTTKRSQYLSPKGFKERLLDQHFTFLLLLVNTMLSAATSVGGAYLTYHASARTLFWQYLLHELYFLFHTSLSAGFTLYVMNVNGTTLGRKKVFYYFFMLPYAVSELVVLTNPFTSLIFYMDDQFIYHRGPMMPLLYGVGALYILLGMVFFFRYKQAISRRDSRTIGAVIGLAVVGIVIQALWSSLLVELFFESVAFLGLMILLENRSGEIDPVTGLFDRDAFTRVNRRLLETGQSYSVIHVRLTNLDLFAKLFGGRDMDRLLVDMADWLGTLTAQENIFHFRTEDFALILYGQDAQSVEEVAGQILQKFLEAWKVEDMTARLEAAVSIIRIPEDVSTLDQLGDLLAVDYQKKAQGLSRIIQGEDLADVKRNLAVEGALRRALAEKALQVWYQPIWSAETGKIVAAEALVRVIDDELGYISPEEFIPIAEKNGMIHELGAFVFEETCRFIQRNNIQEKGIEYVEVNLSLYQFMYEGLVEDLGRLRGIYQVPAERINLEITETASSDAAPSVMETMRQMAGVGYTFSLDDYGTGYSNLIRLISNDYKNVKIDKSILWDAEKNATTARLLDNLIRVVRSLGLNVVQEGVETKEQLDRVVASGCNLIQGFYFSKPLNEADFLEYVAKMNAETESDAG